MVHELYLTKAEARNYAEQMAQDCQGWVSNTLFRMDDRTDFDYKDRAIQDFSGEVPAFAVFAPDGRMVGLFGWTE